MSLLSGKQISADGSSHQPMRYMSRLRTNTFSLSLGIFSQNNYPKKLSSACFTDGLLAQGLLINSIRDVLMILKMILRFGEKLSAWPHVIYDIHFPTTALQKMDVLVLTMFDQRKLLDYLMTNFSLRNLGILICLYSRLRIGEVCALQWKDLDVTTGEIHVTKTVQRIWLSDGDEKEYRLSVGQPKTASSVRNIPICKELMKLIRPFRKVVADDCYVISNGVILLNPTAIGTISRNCLPS